MSEALLTPTCTPDLPVAPPPKPCPEDSGSRAAVFAKKYAGGRLPGPGDALEAILLGEEDIKAGRVVSAEEMIEELERIVAGKV